MFVINANASWSASATAYATGGGGNTAQTSASWYYDIPMNWSTYNMFSVRCWARADWFYCLDTDTYSWWNGNNPSEDSVITYGKASDFDEDVSYPNNMMCCSPYGVSPFGSKFQFCGKKNLAEHNLDEVVEMDLWEIPAINYSTIISRKKFDGWEKIGKTINFYMDWFSLNNRYLSCLQKSESWCNCVWITHTAHKCPITFYFDLWLMHEDGTKTVIQKKEIVYPYYKLEEDKSCTKLWWDETFLEENPTFKLFEWESVNTPVTALKWDRLYFERGVCPTCLLYDVYTETKCNVSCTQQYWIIWYNATGSSTQFCTQWDTYEHHIYHSCCYTSCVCINTPNSCNRFTWIQFSIE